jgi:hypothetical protein
VLSRVWIVAKSYWPLTLERVSNCPCDMALYLQTDLDSPIDLIYSPLSWDTRSFLSFSSLGSSSFLFLPC